jgi:hypothetical protein
MMQTVALDLKELFYRLLILTVGLWNVAMDNFDTIVIVACVWFLLWLAWRASR